MLSHVLVVFDVHNNPAKWKEDSVYNGESQSIERLRGSESQIPSRESRESSFHLQKPKAMFFWPK